MRAVGYVRISSEERAREGYGLAAQEQAVRAYCRAQGWELLEVYSDAGRSGKSMKGRDALNGLLDQARAGCFERIVFWKLDRLARNLRDLLVICDQLEASSIGIVSIQEAIDTGTATGRMIRSVLGALAEFERDVITDRIVAGLAEKARQGDLLGRPPIGYLRLENGSVGADPIMAPLIHELFVRYTCGSYSLREMSQWAISAGIINGAGNVPDRDGIRKILTNPTYTGQTSYHRRSGGNELVNGKHPAVIDSDLFVAAGEVLRRRQYSSPSKPFGREPYPLSGVAVCAFDMAPLLGLKAGSHPRRYMRCSTAHRRGRAACQLPMISAELLEAQIAAYIGDIRLPQEYLSAVVEELRRRGCGADNARTKVERLRRELERWRRLFVLGEIDEERLIAETEPLKRLLKEIERPKVVLDAEQAADYLRNVGSLWAGSSRLLQRKFVKEVFAKVVVNDAQVTAITPNPTYAPLFMIDRRERFDGEMGVVWRPRQDSNLQPTA